MERSLKLRSRADVREAVADMDGQLAGGGSIAGPVKRDTRTVKQAADQYLTAVKPRVARKTYQGAYKYALDKLSTSMGDRRVTAVTQHAIQDFFDGMANTMSASSLRSIRAACHAFFSAVGRKTSNPCEGLRLARPVERIREPYKKADAEKLLDLAKGINQSIYLAVALAYYTGGRITSILRLTWEDVDFEDGRITYRLRGEESLKGKREYQVPLSSKLAEILTNAAAGCDPRPTGAIIRNPERFRSSMAKTALRKQMRKLIALATKKDEHGESAWKGGEINWHRFRHTFAGVLLTGGESIYKVSRWLGHSSVAITQSHYGHLVPETEESIEKL